MTHTNHAFKLAARPVGLPKRSDWTYESNPVAEPADGQILVKVTHISLDPAMRGWMNDAKSYIPPVGIGEVMRAGGGGEVIASRNPQFKVGDQVVGVVGVQQYVLSDGKGFDKVDTSLVPLPVYIGTLGMSGMTAYFGLLDVGELQSGDTVVVSGAAGAVGSVVGQIAKIKAAP
jgi:NADPH-dependent curcumin reductase CurA